MAAAASSCGTRLQIVLLKGWHINNDEMTRDAISRSNIVVNLIGSTLETRNFSFDDVHAAWPARLAAMAKDSPKVRPQAGQEVASSCCSVLDACMLCMFTSSLSSAWTCSVCTCSATVFLVRQDSCGAKIRCTIGVGLGAAMGCSPLQCHTAAFQMHMRAMNLMQPRLMQCCIIIQPVTQQGHCCCSHIADGTTCSCVCCMCIARVFMSPSFGVAVAVAAGVLWALLSPCCAGGAPAALQ
jgi:hypothetical protein